MKRMLLFLLTAVLLLSGCSEKNVAYSVYHNVLSDMTILVVNEQVTTKTNILHLEFRNNTAEEILYSDEAILLEKKEGDGFVTVGSYGNGHEITVGLEAGRVNPLSLSITPLEPGTYRLIFLQGYSTPEGPVYMSAEFTVSE